MPCADDAMGDEFDTMATWTVEAVRSLGRELALPAACRGSGRPAALDWLLDRLEVRTSSALLDVGAGLGGPAVYARDRAGVRVVCLDPVPSACQGAARLFGLPTIVGDGSRLPLAEASVDAAWSLGTLCTTTEKERWLAELFRVVRPGCRLGLLVLVSTGEAFATPWGNAFPSDADLDRLVSGAGFRPLAGAWSADLADPDEAWRAAEQAVDAAIEIAHGDSPRLTRVRDQERRMGRLLESGRVRGRLLVVSRPTSCPSARPPLPLHRRRAPGPAG